MNIRLEYKDKTSNKFWEGLVEGNTLVTRWGKLGTEGQTKRFAFGTPAEATAELDEKAREKTKKGYAAVSVAAPEPAKSAKSGGSAAARPAAPALEPVELTGETIPLSDYPGIFAFSADGKTLAAHGISSVHLVDVPRRAWTATHPSKEASCLQFHDDGLIVGSKTLTLLNRESGKKVRSFKGHNATPNALALSADGKVLWSGGGRYCDTRDRFLFAFDATTGEPIYKVKPGKNAGAMDVAVLGDVLAVAAEDGHLRTFSAAEGKPLGDIALAPPVEHGSSFGGVAVSGASFVAAAVVADVCVVTWLSRDLAVETTAKIALDGSRYLSAEGPFVVAGHIVIPLGMNWTSSDESGVVVAVFDEDTRALVALRTLAGLDDARACTVSADGLVAWKAKGGVQLAELVGAGPKRGVQATSRSQAR